MDNKFEIDAFFSQVKKECIDKYRVLNTMGKKGKILLAGSSLMEQFPVYELLMGMGKNYEIYNRGVSGAVSDEFIENIDTLMFDLQPKQIFINIGTNDISKDGYAISLLEKNYRYILGEISARLPETKTYIVAFYPVNEPMVSSIQVLKNRTNAAIDEANKMLERLSGQYEGCGYINLNHLLKDEHGQLKKEFTVEGVHLYANAYSLIVKELVHFFDE